MSLRSRLRNLFGDGQRPQGQHYAELIDSLAHRQEDAYLFGLRPWQARVYMPSETALRNGAILLALRETGPAFVAADWQAVVAADPTALDGRYPVFSPLKQYVTGEGFKYDARLFDVLSAPPGVNIVPGGPEDQGYYQEVSAAQGFAEPYAQQVYTGGMIARWDGMLIIASGDKSTIINASRAEVPDPTSWTVLGGVGISKVTSTNGVENVQPIGRFGKVQLRGDVEAVARPGLGTGEINVPAKLIELTANQFLDAVESNFIIVPGCIYVITDAFKVVNGVNVPGRIMVVGLPSDAASTGNYESYTAEDAVDLTDGTRAQYYHDEGGVFTPRPVGGIVSRPFFASLADYAAAALDVFAEFEIIMSGRRVVAKHIRYTAGNLFGLFEIVSQVPYVDVGQVQTIERKETISLFKLVYFDNSDLFYGFEADQTYRVTSGDYAAVTLVESLECAATFGLLSQGHKMQIRAKMLATDPGLMQVIIYGNGRQSVLEGLLQNPTGDLSEIVLSIDVSAERLEGGQHRLVYDCLARNSEAASSITPGFTIASGSNVALYTGLTDLRESVVSFSLSGQTAGVFDFGRMLVNYRIV